MYAKTNLLRYLVVIHYRTYLHTFYTVCVCVQILYAPMQPQHYIWNILLYYICKMHL